MPIEVRQTIGAKKIAAMAWAVWQHSLEDRVLSRTGFRLIIHNLLRSSPCHKCSDDKVFWKMVPFLSVRHHHCANYLERTIFNKERCI